MCGCNVGGKDEFLIPAVGCIGSKESPALLIVLLYTVLPKGHADKPNAELVPAAIAPIMMTQCMTVVRF